MEDKRALISLTFDDGWMSQYEYALPILDHYKFKATFYIITGYLSATHEPYMNLHHVMTLHRSGHEIGGHSVTHPNLVLTYLWRRKEVLLSKIDLEFAGIKCDSFAYPYGRQNWYVRKLALNAGYKNARVIGDESNDIGFNRFLINGYIIKSDTTIQQVNSWIDHAERRGHWLVLIFHEVSKMPRQYGCTPEFLDSVCGLIARKQLVVSPVTKAFEAFSDSGPATVAAR